MPFIRRKRVADADATFSKIDTLHEFHVPARKVEKGDVVVPTAEIPDEILRDLATTHPKEYAKAALERGLKPIDDDDDDELEALLAAELDEDDEVDAFSEVQEAFMLLNAEKAIEAVKAAANDPDLLAAYAEAEAAKEQPRKTVLAALQAAIES